jgi:hypothetical protein
MDNKIIAWVQIRKFVVRAIMFVAVVTLLCIKNGKHYDTLESAWVKEFFSIIGNVIDTPERLEWSVHK